MTESASQNAQPTAPAGFDQWAIVELFGHARIAGRVREEMLAGKAFLRVDVPTTPGADAFTRYYGGGAPRIWYELDRQPKEAADA